MPITSFSIQNLKAIKLAECSAVPKVMIISGPNGVGKSTLLHALKRRGGNIQATGKMLYMGPHRAWRRQTVRARFLYANQIEYSSILSQDNMANIEGLIMNNAPRTPDSVDEANGVIKYSLSQLELRRQEAIARKYDADPASLSTAQVDIYEPIKKMIATLLPHLQFVKISMENRDDVQCLFCRADSLNGPFIDIDDLSSGEKAIIGLLLPFLEVEVNRMINSFSGEVTDSEQDIVCIIDEPEIHLHPTLQGKILSYFRNTVTSRAIQFIVSTHSQAIINSANLDELFVLMPPHLTASLNQLVPATSEVTRLEAIRELTGESFAYTSGRTVVFLEGANPRETKSTASDSRLVELMCPEFQSCSLVSMGGKQTVSQLADVLTKVLEPGEGPPIFAIVDRDQGSILTDERIYCWPVSMIENFILDPEAICTFLEPYRESYINLNSVNLIRDALYDIAQEHIEDEINLRIQRSFQPFRWSFRGSTPTDLLFNVEDAKRKLDEIIGSEASLTQIVNSVRAEVDQIWRSGMALQLFHGKTLSKQFYGKYISKLGIGYKAYSIEIARIIGQRGGVPDIRDIWNRIDHFIPEQLQALLHTVQSWLSDVEPLKGEFVSLAQRFSSALDAYHGNREYERGDLKYRLLDILHRLNATETFSMSPEKRQVIDKAYRYTNLIRN